MKKALLIIDVQNDYFPDGNCELYKPEIALNNIKIVLKQFRGKNLPVFYVQHIANKEAAFFVPETYGVHIHKDIKPLETECTVVKHYPNSFHETNLHQELIRNEITHLIVCGMMTHMCVDTTIRSAKDYGYNIALISDGCATKDLEWNGVHITVETIQNVYMASLNQKFANVITCAQFLQS